MTVTDLDHALVDILSAISGAPSLPMEYCDPLPPAGPIRSTSAFPSLVFSCPPLREDHALHEKIDHIMAMIPPDLHNIFADSSKSSQSTITDPPLVSHLSFTRWTRHIQISVGI
jgi:hypothetical protein